MVKATATAKLSHVNAADEVDTRRKGKKSKKHAQAESSDPSPGTDVVWDAAEEATDEVMVPTERKAKKSKSSEKAAGKQDGHAANDAATVEMIEATERKAKKSKSSKKAVVKQGGHDVSDTDAARDAQASENDAAVSLASASRVQGRKRANVGDDDDDDDNGRAIDDATPSVLYEKKKARGTKTKKLADGKLPCAEFAASMTCRFGDKCKFSHLLEGQPLPDGAKGRRKRRATCIAFAEGTCKYGDRCRYVKHFPNTSEGGVENDAYTTWLDCTSDFLPWL